MRKLTGWVKNLKKPEKILLILAVLFIAGTVGATGGEQTPTKPQNPPTQPQSTVTTKTVTEIQSIPFGSTNVNDPNLDKGKTAVTTTGVNGTRTLTYKITYENGKQTNKQLVNSEVTTPPIDQVTSIGTYVAPAPPQRQNCDPNYTGACVPNVYPADVDCAGGSGNGPYYVQGPVTVVGTDRYGLDRDGNGVGCE